MRKTRITLHFPSRVTIDSHNSTKIVRAIIYAYSLLYGKEETDNLINEEFATTDLLYWAQRGEDKDKEIYFYPKPIHSKKLSKELGNSQYTRLKTYKKITFVSESIIKDYYDKMLSFLRGENNVIVKNKLAFLENEHINIIRKFSKKAYNMLPRIRTGNENTSQEFFFVPEQWIGNGGLYFELVYDKEAIFQKIKTAIYFLEDRGIGKKISSGDGNFKIKKVENLPSNKNEDKSDLKLLLSHWIPSQNDINKGIIPVYYSLIKYQPIMQKVDLISPREAFPHKTIHMITSGSIVSSTSSIPLIIGKNVEINHENEPKNIVWGRAVTHPISI